MKTAKKIRLYDLLILGALTSVSLLSSCQKKLDTDLSASDGMLRFEVSDAPQWQAGNVAASKAEPIDSASLKVQKIGDVWEDGQQMYLHTSVEQMGSMMQTVDADSTQTATKGAVINQGKFHNTFGIMAMAYAGTSYTSGFTPTFMYNVKATGGGSADVIAINQNTIFQTANKFFIPHNKNVALFAYAPYKETGSTDAWITLPVADKNWSAGRPQYTVEVPQYLADQKDLCFAEATASSSSNGRTALNFLHAMAAVRFDIASSVATCTVKSITLKNVRYKGTVNPNEGSTSGWWTSTEEKRDFSYNNGNQGISHTKGTQTNVFGAEKAFFMIPQSKDGITLEIVVQVGTGTQRTLTTALPANWSKGNKYNYTLSFSPEDPTTFEITTPTSGGVTWQTDGTGYKTGTVTEPGGTYTFNIQSHKNGTKRDYKVQYRTSTSGKWTDLPANSNTLLIGQSKKTDKNGGSYTHTFQVYQQYTIKSSQNTTLKGKNPVGSWARSTPLDVNSSGQTTSANCYIVTGPGIYSFGTAYGNAYKDGAQNSKVLGKYKDYKTATISALKMNGASARVLWTDVPGLISEVRLEGQLLSFNVPQATIQEGNALIGLFDGAGLCMWSWHIWVTPDALKTIDIPNVGNNSQKEAVATRPIGYVNPGKADWRNATLYVRFIQSNGSGGWNENTAKQFTIRQTGPTNVDTPGRYLVYQWGRKDPMWPMAATSTGQAQNAPVYPGPAGNTDYLPNLTVLQINGLNPTYGQLIQNPHRPYATVVSDIVRKACLWNAAVDYDPEWDNRYETLKSMYDPSPIGFKVAPPGTFDAFAHNGSSYKGSIAQPVNPLVPQGGYGQGSTVMNLVSHDTKNRIAHMGIQGSGTTFPIPLLGCRAYETDEKGNALITNNFIASRVGTNFFTWMSSRQDGNYCCAFGLYINTYESWIDLYGVGKYTSGTFEQRSMRNCFPVIPVKE